MNIIIGLIFSSIIAVPAYKKNSLNASGLIGAILLGTLIYYFGGVLVSAIMVSFFVSSSIFSKIGKSKKESLDDLHEKGDARDFIQVFANGGIALIMASIYFYTNNELFLIASAVSFASSNADTWASEIGVLSKRKPVSILTFKPIENGLSGGISFLGTFASLIGSGFIATVFCIFYGVLIKWKLELIFDLVIISAFGFFGSLIDSILGATIQAQYWNEEKQKFTEKKTNYLTKGNSLINNDFVNIFSNALVTVFSIVVLIVVNTIFY